MALLDAPDIDSVVSANRAIATQLLSAADLWLFVTTAARYADAVPWDLLRTAADRGTAVAIVLDRIPPEAVDEIRPHLAAMLREQGLPTAPIFTRPRDHARRRRAPAGGGRRAAALVARRPWPATPGPARSSSGRPCGAPSTRSSGRTGRARRRQPRPARRRQVAAQGGRRVLRRRASADVDARHDRRHPPARRGARPLAGVRRHRRVLPAGRDRRSRAGRDRITAAIKGEPPPAERPRRGAADRGRRAAALQRARRRPPRRSRAWRSPARRRPAAQRSTPTSPSRRPGLPSRRRAARARLAGRGARAGAHRGPGPAHQRPHRGLRAQRASALFLMLVAFGSTGGLVGAEIGIAGGTAVLAQTRARGDLRRPGGARDGGQGARSCCSSSPTSSTPPSGTGMPPPSPRRGHRQRPGGSASRPRQPRLRAVVR